MKPLRTRYVVATLKIDRNRDNNRGDFINFFFFEFLNFKKKKKITQTCKRVCVTHLRKTKNFCYRYQQEKEMLPLLIKISLKNVCNFEKDTRPKDKNLRLKFRNRKRAR